MRPIFVTAIDTNIGKTVVSSILVDLFHADYWKPIQCGDLENSDTLNVKSLTSTNPYLFNEAHKLKTPASPNIAAEIEHIHLKLEDFKAPQTNKNLIIEGAGGVLVPFNDHQYIIDIAKFNNANIVLVTKNYLGSINHTLLAVEAIRARGLVIAAIIFNGARNHAIEKTVLSLSKIKTSLYLTQETEVNPMMITRYAEQWKKELPNE